MGLDENGKPVPADADGNDQLAMQPFMVAHINPDEKMESFIPQRPGNMYNPFVVAQLRAIAASLGVSYEQLARDFTTTNFSGLRQALSEDRKEVELTQKLLSESVLAIIWNEFVYCCVMEGRLPAIPVMDFTAYPDKYTYCNWRGAGFKGIDPSKDQSAKEKAVALGTMTLEQAAQDDGGDWREIADQQAIEKAYRAEKGLEAQSKTSGMAELIDVLANVSTGAIAPDAGYELLLMLQMSPESASKAINAQINKAAA
jgi:lambda family phage portal protein